MRVLQGFCDGALEASKQASKPVTAKELHTVSVLTTFSFLDKQSFLQHTGLFISPSETSELDCATTKTETAERSISIGRESLKVFICTRGLGVLHVPPLGSSRDEKWRAQ